VLASSGEYTVVGVEPVGEVRTLLSRMRTAAGKTGSLLAGFDFPIGLPAAYARKMGITDFPGFLRSGSQAFWESFFDVARYPQEISLQRPFYPDRPGAASQAHLLAALGMQDMNQLRRVCELASSCRRPASPLFWTMGGQQVGKAAISGWRELLIPALADPQVAARTKIWPFSGPLTDLLAGDDTVLAETYPAEFYVHLGLDLRQPGPAKGQSGRSSKQQKTGKRSQASRRANAAQLLGWAERQSVAVDSDTKEKIEDGFGSHASGEDPFDALVGLFGMLNIVLGGRPAGEPPASKLTPVEGWILGQLMEENPV